MFLKMKYAFDWNGVISNHEWAREMAKALLKAGHEVHCITAAHPSVKGTGFQESLVASSGVPFTKVHVVYGDIHSPDPDPHWAAGLLKAEVMKEIGAEMIIDDVPPVVLAIRSKGFVALHLG